MIEVEKHVRSDRTVYCIKGTDILHREDGPAIELVDGRREWLVNGKLHREDGPAVEWPDGSKCWYINGRQHRVSGPALEWSDGAKEWYINGKIHREDGPAAIYSNGKVDWYLNGVSYSKEEWFEALTKKQKVKALYSEYFIGD